MFKFNIVFFFFNLNHVIVTKQNVWLKALFTKNDNMSFIVSVVQKLATAINMVENTHRKEEENLLEKITKLDETR